MQTETFVEYIVEMVTNKDFKNISEDFKKESFIRLEQMYERYLEDAYKKGKSEGYLEGLTKGVELLSKSLIK
jgi:flagellar biosynthesis/type III secretory pathway protein FliH